jgi:hypothetical protein
MYEVRLLERIVVWAVIIVASLFGAFGSILLKLGTNQLGEITPQRFLDISFVIRYLLTPTVFGALVFFFLGRFLMGSPISTFGVTQTVVVITILGMIFTLFLETLIFHQKYDLWTYIGILIGLVSIGLIARGMTSS